MSHFGDSEFPGSDPLHQGSEDSDMANVPRSMRGTSVHPGAEHMMMLDTLRQKSSGSIPVASASASGDTTKGDKPEMNFDDAQDTEGDVDDGDKKRQVQANRPEPERRPDLVDETTVVAAVGYPEKVLADADSDRSGPDSLQPETVAEPATARKAGGMTTK